jgi:hypothetical protein
MLKTFACRKFRAQEAEFEGDPEAELCEGCGQCQGCHEGTPEDTTMCEVCTAEVCEKEIIYDYVDGSTKVVCTGCYQITERER